MSLIYDRHKVPSLSRYHPEINADGTERHEICDGARFHVLSYALENGKPTTRCSEPRCEINKHGDIGAAIIARMRK